MRRTDITPGEVYAYDEGGYKVLKKIVFLTPLTRDHIYTASRDRPAGSPLFIRAERMDAPGRYQATLYGFLAAIGKDAGTATLSEAASTETAFPEGKEYCYALMVTMKQVTGPWAEVIAERKAEKERLEAGKKAAKERNMALSGRMAALHARLTALGVDASLYITDSIPWTDSDYSRKTMPPRYFRMTEDQAASLVTLIEGLKEEA